MDRLEIGQFVVVGIDAKTEEEARVSTIDDLEVAELNKVGLIFLVPWCDKTMDLALEL